MPIQFPCPPAALAKLTAAATAPGMCRELVSSELAYIPVERTEIPEYAETEKQLENLVVKLENDEDVLSVWTTIDD